MNASKGIFETLGDSVSENFRKGMDNNLYNNMYSTTTKGVQGVIDSINSKVFTISSKGTNLKTALVNALSDGLYNNITEQELYRALSVNETPTQKVDTVINIANMNGGSDNISIACWEAFKNA